MGDICIHIWDKLSMMLALWAWCIASGWTRSNTQFYMYTYYIHIFIYEKCTLCFVLFELIICYCLTVRISKTVQFSIERRINPLSNITIPCNLSKEIIRWCIYFCLWDENFLFYFYMLEEIKILSILKSILTSTLLHFFWIIYVSYFLWSKVMNGNKI